MSSPSPTISEPVAGPVLLRAVPESRPTAHRWQTAASTDDDHGQPTLWDVLPDDPDDANRAPQPTGVRIHRDTGPGSMTPAGGLPDPASWAAVLAVAVGQVLVGARPLGQLQSWLDAPLLADLRYEVRRRSRRPGPPLVTTPPVRALSVRIQCPTPTTVESTIHVRIGSGSMVLGARLEAQGDRWLCTALARPATGVSGRRTARDTT